MKRVYIQFCPFCGKSEKLGYEGFRLRCYVCGRLFEVKELPLLRVIPPGYKP